MKAASWEPAAFVEPLRKVLATVRGTLPDEDVSNIGQLIDVGEWALAVEILCTQLYEYDIDVELETIQRIAAVGERLEVPAHY